jgi:hypothetical protein
MAQVYPIKQLSTQQMHQHTFLISGSESTKTSPNSQDPNSEDKVTPTDVDEPEEVYDEPPRFPKVYLDSIFKYNIVILAFLGLYTLAYLGQLMSGRALSDLIYYSFPRFDEKPGAFINDRGNYFAVIMAIASTKIGVIFTGIWMLRPVTESLKRTINMIFIIFFLVFDALILISLGIAWGFLCNTSGIGYAPCNAYPADVCSVHGSSLPQRCMPPYPSPAAVLSPIWAFYVYITCIIATFLLHIILLFVNIFLDDTARDYTRSLVFAQRRQ